MMDNADKPAYPTRVTKLVKNGFGDIVSRYPKDQAGLTKRERFAMAAMQGILSNPNYEYDNLAEAINNVSRISKNHADALLNELENTEE